MGQKLQSIWQVPVAAGAPASAEEEFTTWKFRSCGESRRTIDYIWFSSQGGLKPASRWQMPSQADIGPQGLPCDIYPSDHLSVCCDFRWAAADEQI